MTTSWTSTPSGVVIHGASTGSTGQPPGFGGATDSGSVAASGASGSAARAATERSRMVSTSAPNAGPAGLVAIRDTTGQVARRRGADGHVVDLVGVHLVRGPRSPARPDGQRRRGRYGLGHRPRRSDHRLTR